MGLMFGCPRYLCFRYFAKYWKRATATSMRVIHQSGGYMHSQYSRVGCVRCLPSLAPSWIQLGWLDLLSLVPFV